ncbi:phage tail tape measure protein [Rhodococcus marinonascens]|uniref:phage tail tape measure protein n=1 Tax=Rhodococcus marinonascens TaxID=38311 RepID=UPI000933FE8D|nr:phage tail tape measure protein [Rhodococcus marinonascens]
MAGGRIDIEVRPDTRRFSSTMEGGLRGVVGKAAKLGSAFGLAFGAAAGAKAVIDIGNDFTNSLNNLQAVSQASAEELAKVGEYAKELGNDLELPGVSANTAADAMTTLVKAGFSVEEAMSAAKGTLQLATAAGMGAADAAMVQASALQSFGLGAEDAARASDVLANAANSSSAAIPDIANGLAQAGTVANQFGLSLEETTSSLALFANAGITGSDAGTLLKTALLATTKESKSAQNAIDTLGLTMYDTEGNFVGLESLFGQLQTASQNLTPEVYNTASANLFGSDAARMAGVAAAQGAAGFDAMEASIGKQGTAAEVAAAKSQGLPGAMESVSNSAETLALSIYQLIDGPLETFAGATASAISGASDNIIGGLTAVGSAAQPVIGFMGDAVDVFQELPGPVQAATAALIALKITGVSTALNTSIATTGGAFARFSQQMATQTALAAASGQSIGRLGASMAVLETRSPAIGRMAGAYRTAAGPMNAFASSQRRLASSSGALVAPLRNATSYAANMGAVAGGAAAAGLSGMKTAAGGVMNALGGPWILGIVAAAVAVYGIVGATSAVADAEDAARESALKFAAAQREVGKAFQESEGDINDTVMTAEIAAIDEALRGLESTAENAPSWLDQQFTFWWNEKDVQNAVDMGAEAERTSEAFEYLKVDSEVLASAIAGSDVAFRKFLDTLREAPEGGDDAADWAIEQRKKFLKVQESAKTLTPGVYEIAESIDALADSSSDAESKSRALLTVLDTLAGRQVPLAEAVSNYEAKIDELTEPPEPPDPENPEDLVDRNLGYGSEGPTAITHEDGRLNLDQENARTAQDEILGLRQAAVDVALAGGDIDEIFRRNEEAYKAKANQYGVNQDTVRSWATGLGLDRETIQLHVDIKGGDEAAKDLLTVKDAFDKTPGTKRIEVDAVDQQARDTLTSLGFAVEDLPNANVEVVANNAMAMAGLDNVLNRIVELDMQGATPEITADNTKFQVTNQESLDALKGIDTTTVSTEARLLIDDLEEGTEVSLQRLQEITDADASNEVQLIIAQALTDAAVFNTELDKAARNRKSTITIDVVRTAAAQDAFNASGQQGPIAPILQDNGSGSGDNGSGSGDNGSNNDSDPDKPRGRAHVPSGNAAGGRLPTTGPGTAVTDGILGVAASGMPITRVDAGEWIINHRSSEEYDGELAAINAGTFPKLPGYAEGGRVGPAPQAPGLTTTFTDEELDRRALERAAARANDRRNEVYADSEATQLDRDEADDALRIAGSDLNEDPNEKASSSGFTAADPVDLVGNVAKSFVTGYLDDTLGGIGLDSGLGAVGAAITGGIGVAQYMQEQQQKAQPSRSAFSGAELAMGGLGADEVLAASQAADYRQVMAGCDGSGSGGVSDAAFDRLADEVRKLASRPNSTYNITTRDVEENERRIRQIHNLNALGAGSRF